MILTIGEKDIYYLEINLIRKAQQIEIIITSYFRTWSNCWTKGKAFMFLDEDINTRKSIFLKQSIHLIKFQLIL